MATTLCKVMVAAYLAADHKCEIKMEEVNGQQRVARTSWARFRILHNPFGKDRNGNERKVIALNCVVFGALAKVVNDYLKKGSAPTVIGNLVEIGVAFKDGAPIKTQGGELIVNTELEVTDIQLPPKGSGGNGESNGATKAVAGETPANEPDLSRSPF